MEMVNSRGPFIHVCKIQAKCDKHLYMNGNDTFPFCKSNAVSKYTGPETPLIVS